MSARMLKPSVDVCRGTLSRSASSHPCLISNAPAVSRRVVPVSTSSASTRQLIVPNGMRRSPVVTPDIAVGKGDEEMHLDLFNYLLRQRIVFLGGYVNDKMATQIVGSLLALEQLDEEEDIRVYINSSGGQPYSIFGVLDTMKSIKPDIQTVALGACYSYASLILAAGTKGKRYSMKNTRIMMTQPMGGSQGDMYQVQKTVEELNAIYQMCCKYYMNFTGMSEEKVELVTNRDFFMTPEEALFEGLIDGIVSSKVPDKHTPPSVIRRYKEAGLIDDVMTSFIPM